MSQSCRTQRSILIHLRRDSRKYNCYSCGETIENTITIRAERQLQITIRALERQLQIQFAERQLQIQFTIRAERQLQIQFAIREERQLQIQLLFVRIVKLIQLLFVWRQLQIQLRRDNRIAINWQNE